MNIQSGYLYFISDSFFHKVSDPYLKQDHISTKRPHYFAYKDLASGLIWVVPCSTQCQKYEDIITKREKQGKPTDTIKFQNGIGGVPIVKDMVLDMTTPRLYIVCFSKVNFTDNSEMKTYRIVHFVSTHKDVD